MSSGRFCEQLEGDHSGDRFHLGMPWELQFAGWGCLADTEWHPATEARKLYPGCHGRSVMGG